jgi:hypothetical protein
MRSMSIFVSLIQTRCHLRLPAPRLSFVSLAATPPSPTIFMNSNDPDIFMGFANETGLEIFQILVKRSDTLGTQTFEDIFGALMAATAVCLANVLRPAVEAAPDRAAAADSLIAVCGKRARLFLDPVIANG